MLAAEAKTRALTAELERLKLQQASSGVELVATLEGTSVFLALCISLSSLSSRSVCQRACSSLATCTRVAVDCEGVSLSKHGRLTLVQVADRSKVYLFDVIALTATDVLRAELIANLSRSSRFYTIAGKMQSLCTTNLASRW